jgi:hypothetical protein
MRILIVGASLFTLAFPAASQAAPAAHRAKPAAPPTMNVTVVDKAHAAPNFDAMFALIDKLFPPQPDPDPARLALARTAVGAMWPDGAYGKMMTGLMGGMIDQAMQLKESDFASLAGKAPKTPAAANGKELSLHDQAMAKDPYFDQRVAAIREAVTEEIGKLSAVIDPRMREGLSRSMARRFDERQLADINIFFATSSGRALAGQYLQLWADPDTLRSLIGSMPDMMKLMPEMMQKVKAADDKFPKPPKTASAPAKP